MYIIRVFRDGVLHHETRPRRIRRNFDPAAIARRTLSIWHDTDHDHTVVVAVLDVVTR